MNIINIFKVMYIVLTRTRPVHFFQSLGQKHENSTIMIDDNNYLSLSFITLQRERETYPPTVWVIHPLDQVDHSRFSASTRPH